MFFQDKTLCSQLPNVLKSETVDLKQESQKSL